MLFFFKYYLFHVYHDVLFQQIMQRYFELFQF